MRDRSPSRAISTTPRRLLGASLLALGLLAASVAYSGLVVRRIVTDGDVAASAADAALADDKVQRLLVDETAQAVGTQLLGPQTLASLEAIGYDPSADLHAIAEAVVADPAFRAEFVGTVRALHQVVLVEPGPAPVVELHELVATARAAALERNEAYAALFPTTGTFRVTLPTDELPDLTGASGTLEARARQAAAVAAVAIAAAAVVHPRRPRVVRRVGTWAIGVALSQAAVALVLPVAAGRVPGDLQPVARAVAETLQPRLLVPAALVAAMGLALVVSAWRWQRALDRGLERLGAESFLGAEDATAFVDGRIETAELRSPMGAPPMPLVGAVSPAAAPTTHRGG